MFHFNYQLDIKSQSNLICLSVIDIKYKCFFCPLSTVNAIVISGGRHERQNEIGKKSRILRKRQNRIV